MHSLDQSGFDVGGTDISISLIYPGFARLDVFWRALGIVHDIPLDGRVHRGRDRSVGRSSHM